MTKQNPFDHFDKWYKHAESQKKVKEVSAMNLATSTKDGVPSSRMVLLKGYDEDGFVFYTNLESRKGKEIKDNPNVALCIFWEPLGRQIRIEGKAEPVSDAEADEYFASRPLTSRIGAVASKQSRPLINKGDLLKKVAEITAKIALGDVKRPQFWSGFRVIPTRFEFWQKGEYRLHDRICHTLKNGAWTSELLYP